MILDAEKQALGIEEAWDSGPLYISNSATYVAL